MAIFYPFQMDEGTLELTVWLVMVSFLHRNSLQDHSLIVILPSPQQAWSDVRLKWKKEDYENLDIIHESTNSIWIPELNLFNE